MIVLDSNILLEDASTLQTYELEDILIIPEIVLDEVDSKKTGDSELAFQARSVGRILAKGKIVSSERTSTHVITTVDIGRTIEIVSKHHYEAVGEASILNDRKIIEIAKDFDAEFISNDVMARIRAISEGLVAKPLDLVDDTEIETFRTLTIDTFDKIEGMFVKDLDKDFKLEVKSYLLQTVEGNQKLAIVVNGKFQLLDEDELVRQEASPLNKEQKVLSAAILSNAYGVIVSDSKAGSGKGVVTLSSMMKLVKQKKYSNIFYVRNTVNNFDKAEEVGFLATNEAKFEQFYTPLYDTLRFFAEQALKANKYAPDILEEKVTERTEMYMSKYNIKPITTLGLRGRTLRGLIWIDEPQNFSAGSLKTLLTRVGKDSMVVLTGCQSQIDNPYLNKHNNGFALIKETTKKDYKVKTFSVTLEKVVRGEITEFAEEVFG